MPGFLSCAERGTAALIGALAPKFEDSRYPRRIAHSLLSLLRAAMAMIAPVWGDPNDAVRLDDYHVLAAVTLNPRASSRAATAFAAPPLEVLRSTSSDPFLWPLGC